MVHVYYAIKRQCYLDKGGGVHLCLSNLDMMEKFAGKVSCPTTTTVDCFTVMFNCNWDCSTVSTSSTISHHKNTTLYKNR